MSAGIAEELAGLLGSMEAWVREGNLAGTASAWLGQHVGGSQECAICPLCQLLALVRKSSPETFGHLLQAAESLTAALRSVTPAPRPPQRPGVVRIDVT